MNRTVQIVIATALLLIGSSCIVVVETIQQLGGINALGYYIGGIFFAAGLLLMPKIGKPAVHPDRPHHPMASCVHHW